MFPGRLGPFLAAAMLSACGGTTRTGTEKHVDVADAATSGSGGRSGTGGAGTSNGGSITIAYSADAGVDGGVSQMSCTQLRTAWSSFAQTHATCSIDTDCTNFLAIAPGSDPCGAPPGLNRALNVESAGDAQSYADRYFQLTCGGDDVTRPNARNGLWSDFGYDGTALVNPRCVSGLCSADSLQCNTNPPFDGGPPDASGNSCPGTAGPTMVRVPAPDGTTYCIDSTEVTNRQYMEFLFAKKSGPDGGVDGSGQDPWCSWNTSYGPEESSNPQEYDCLALYDPYARPDYPMVCIDLCDARAYCKWAGKRLCGKISGGPNSYSDYADATKSQWFNACSKGGTTAYPYGNTFDPAACNGAPTGPDRMTPVGSMATCEGGYRGVFDLSGNVWEWEDSCSADAGKGDTCHLRGGSFHNDGGLQCDDLTHIERSQVDGNVGFRCCAE